MNNNTDLICEEASLRKFPKDLFSRSQRRHGCIGVHLAAFCYATGVLVIVMHAYFKGVVMVILERSNIRRSLAVSSVIPAGMAMPAFCVSVIGTFITHKEVEGFAVVGCSVFNIFVVLFVCGIVTTPCLKVHWYSIWRDNVWFSILAVSLVWISADSVIHYTEAALIMCSYCVYALILRFNESVERGTRRVVLKYRIGEKNDEWPETDIQLEKKPLFRRPSLKKFVAPPIPEEQVDSEYDQCRSDSEVTLTKGRFVTINRGYVSGEVTEGAGYSSEPNMYSSDGIGRRSGYSSDVSLLYAAQKKRERGSFFFTSHLADYEEGPKSAFEAPKGVLKRIIWFASLPVICILYLTIPDCREKRRRKWWPLTMIMSLVWTALLSYVITWITMVAADTFMIPGELSSLILLPIAIGMPNLVSSVIYSREGQGIKNNFPICHSLGSNIFMLSFCLGFPWLLKSTINGKVIIENQGFFYILLCYFAVFMFPFIPQINRWKIDRAVGVVFLMLYVSYIVIAVLIQLNVFGYLVTPYCKVRY